MYSIHGIIHIFFGRVFCKLIFLCNAISNDNNMLNIWIMTSATFSYKLSLKFHLKTQLLPIKTEIVERDVLFIFVVLIYYLSLAYMCEVGKIIFHRLLKSNITPSLNRSMLCVPITRKYECCLNCYDFWRLRYNTIALLIFFKYLQQMVYTCLGMPEK